MRRSSGSVSWKWKTKSYALLPLIFPRRWLTQKDLPDRGKKLIAQGKATLTVAARVLKFSRQAFYKWRAKPVSDRQLQEHKLIDKIRQIHSDDPEFGYRFIADELHGQGIVISQRRVWWLCSKGGIFSVISRRKRRGRKAGPPVHDDLLQRHFHGDTPNTAWVTDITEHWTWEGETVLVCDQRSVLT